MALLVLHEIEKHFGDRPVLRGLGLVVDEGDRIGVVGRNGAGKTTLLRVLAGTLEPDGGARTPRRGLKIAYLEQEPVFDPDETVQEAVARSGAAEHEVAAMIDRVGLPEPSRACGAMSGGEQRRAAVARALLGRPDLLLLDEPTNHLDAFVTDWLEGFLKDQRLPLVMVTHDRYFLDRIANRIVELDRGALHEYRGGYLAFLDARAARLEAEEKAESARLNLLRRESEWMRRGPQGRGTKAKARIRRFSDLVDAAREAAPGEVQLEIPPGPNLGKKVVHLKDVAYGGLFEDLSLHVEQRARIGIVGPNGAGKTTLLHVMMGLLEPDAGEVEIGSTVAFGYVDQTRGDLDPDNSLFEEIGGGNTSVKVGERMVRIEPFLDRFLFRRQDFRTRVGELSGGERNRILLAKLMLKGGNVLVLDEPTNDLDLMTLRVLEEALQAFPGAVLVVSHDRFLLDRVATAILYLDGKGGARLHPSDMTSLLAELKAERQPAPRKEKAARTKTRDPARLSYHEQRELDALPEKIAKLEEESRRLDAELGDPALYGKAATYVKEVATRRKEIEAEIDALYERWQELDR